MGGGVGEARRMAKRGRRTKGIEGIFGDFPLDAEDSILGLSCHGVVGSGAEV